MDTQESPRNVFVARLVLGLAQGLALYLLYSAFDQKVWPATVPMLFAPLTVVALFIPLVVLQGLGNLRLVTLLIWTAAASLIVAGLAFYDIWHAWPGALVTPSGHAFFVGGVFLFVAHALVSCGDADRRIVAHYPTLFDLAWKLGVQIAIAACFVLSFWLMVWLGVALFDMIKLTGFSRFIGHPWVWIPLTTIATAVSIHVTDTRATLVRGVRTLALTLLGWLLPVIALIAFAFLISLVFTGLQPLWETRSATFLLMAAAAVLVIHINAAYQDGDPEHRPPHILRVAGTLAAVLLIFIVWIAGYSLWLRVGQYGWTVDRIISAACVLIAGVFAVGYLIAAILPGLWLKLIERWNVYGTFAFLIVLFALSTPIADPMRLSVADQMHRLESGTVKAERFDFWYLRSAGGRFGHRALAALSGSKDRFLRDTAVKALKARGYIDMPHVGEARPAAVFRDITVHPTSKGLPKSFLQQNWYDTISFYFYEACFSGHAMKGWRCDAYLKDLDGDGVDEVLLTYAQANRKEGLGNLILLKFRQGRWHEVGTSGTVCIKDWTALEQGAYGLVPARQPDLKIGGSRVALAPAHEITCPTD